MSFICCEHEWVPAHSQTVPASSAGLPAALPWLQDHHILRAPLRWKRTRKAGPGGGESSGVAGESRGSALDHEEGRPGLNCPSGKAYPDRILGDIWRSVRWIYLAASKMPHPNFSFRVRSSGLES